jgi:hypothetical protein
MGRIGGGVGVGLLSAYSLAGRYEKGGVREVVTTGFGDVAGTASGALTLAGASAGAAMAGAFAAGYVVGTLFREHFLSEETNMKIGGAIFHTLEAVGFNPIDW